MLRAPSLLLSLQLFWFWLCRSQGTYPLEPPKRSEKCMCQTARGFGWDHREGKCMKGARTDCLECPYMRRCSSISDLVGNGDPVFRGDCRPHTGLTCATAKEASLSSPVSVAIDEQDNIYIADQGNNRIRMYIQSEDTLISIAGTGELGFFGDGGSARRAKLRSPESVAVKPGVNLQPGGIGREVYFSDFGNQRIRKLILASPGVWTIHTIAGTGSTGDNPKCDTGCDALKEATLWYPRALAFSSTQDLYFVDSGSRKVRRLTTYIGPPSATTSGVISKFVGLKSKYSNESMLSSLGHFAKTMLPGHWEQLNEAVQLRAMYFLNIDNHDRLWYVDSANNRVFLAPLVSGIDWTMTGDFGKYLDRFLYANFLGYSKSTERQAKAQDLAKGLKAWLPLEFSQNLPGITSSDARLKVELKNTRFKTGSSYWRWGEGSPDGSWCPDQQPESLKTCEGVTAQFSSLSGIIGFCFDAADNVYLAEEASSQVIYFESDHFNIGSGVSKIGQPRKTIRGCNCYQYWSTETEQTVKGSRIGPEECTVPRSACEENPDRWTIIKNLCDADVYSSINQAVTKLPSCKATNYCYDESGTTPGWCYVDALASDDCAVLTWDFCAPQTAKPGVLWKVTDNAAILGNEVRETREVELGSDAWEEIKPNLTEDLWLLNSTAEESAEGSTGAFANVKIAEVQKQLRGTDVLTGFVLPGGTQAFKQIPPICVGKSECCGLIKTGIATDGGTICSFSHLNDTHILEAYLKLKATSFASGGRRLQPSGMGGGKISAELKTVWKVLEQIDQVDITRSATLINDAKKTLKYTRIEDCKTRCMYDPACTGFMTGYDRVNKTHQILSWVNPCIFFTKNYPFSVYKLDRTQDPFNSSSLELNFSNPADYLKASLAFKGPFTPHSRFVSPLGDGIHISSDGQIISKDTLGGGSKDAALMLKTCQDLCLNNTACNGIVYPGCYLLKASEVPNQKEESATSVFVKEFQEPQIRNAAGQHKVYAYKENGGKSDQAYLNRPSACVVNSKGDLLVADTKNHRIRKVAGYNVECVYHDKFEKSHVLEWQTALETISTTAKLDAATLAIYTNAQQDVLENRSTEVFYNTICNYDNAALTAFTRNSYVLCTLCNTVQQESSGSRPTICPSENLCKVRSAIAQAATSYIYLNCPGQSAYLDKWHLFITAFVRCIVSDHDQAKWMTGTDLTNLKAALKAKVTAR
eukprot:TRINITY_DN8084_c0_g2_i1.p1 TRINITY_DN8084_c0_g2~~TRINITY_DN8084_c0_g2_i1.p1  ORF type:complete len:1208 (+),score=188.14 TRINITY_DN8084_c0_g2_i1:226-3849(+)